METKETFWIQKEFVFSTGPDDQEIADWLNYLKDEGQYEFVSRIEIINWYRGTIIIIMLVREL